MTIRLLGLFSFPLCTFVSFVVEALKALTTKDTKGHKGMPATREHLEQALCLRYNCLLRS
jgi:hypothetical protein